jgi:hypothetical protein
MKTEYGADVGTILRAPAWTAQMTGYVALTVILSFWVVLLTTPSYDRNPHPHTHSAKTSQPCSLNTCKITHRSLLRAGRRPITNEQGALLHGKPALALRSSNYPTIDFLKLPDTGYEAPDLSDLDPLRTLNPYVVIAYNDSFFGKVWEDQQRLCPVPCFVSSDTARWSQRADVMVFHAPTMDYDLFLQLKKPMGQLWALHSMESDSYYPGQKRKSPILRSIDIMVSACTKAKRRCWLGKLFSSKCTVAT